MTQVINIIGIVISLYGFALVIVLLQDAIAGEIIHKRQMARVALEMNRTPQDRERQERKERNRWNRNMALALGITVEQLRVIGGAR